MERNAHVVDFIMLVCAALNVYGCNQTSLGNLACIHIPRYNEEQWSSCVTDLYIRQKSKGRHGCPIGQMVCFYQCMLEEHGENAGIVRDPCTCSKDDRRNMDAVKAVQMLTPTLPLQSWCFTPSGADCNWFETCLARRFSCGEKFRGEVIRFAKEFCKLYLNPYSELSRKGLLWVNGVRKCMQISLVTMLRKWQVERTDVCETLTRNALRSFKHCFHSPFPGVLPTLCELPLNDLWRIFWNLRQKLENEKAHRSLLAFLQIIEKCRSFQESTLTNGNVRKLIFQVKPMEIPNSELNMKISSQTLNKKFTPQFCFDREDISWFAYAKKPRYSLNNKIDFHFFVADKREHLMIQRTSLKTLVNLNRTVWKLVEAVRMNKKCYKNGAPDAYYDIISTTVCENLECGENSFTVQTVAHSYKSKATKTNQISGGFYAMFVLITYNMFRV